MSKKIIGLKAENVLNLKAVELTPDGKTVVLTGKNGAGKSAVLDSIYMALTGQKVDEPIRKGEERAEVTVTLDDIVVRRIWTPAGSRLEVTTRDGQANFAKPQALLDKILGDLTFNPLMFAEKGKTEPGRREQREILMRLAGLDFSVQEKRKTELYGERTVKNRDVKRLEGALASMQKPAADLPAEEASLADQLEVIEAMEEARRKHGLFMLEKVTAENAIKGRRDKIATAKAQIEQLQRDIAELEQQNTDAERELAAAKAPATVTDEELTRFRAELAGLEKKNAAIRAAWQYRETVKLLELAQAEVDALTKDIEAIDAEKAQLMAAAKFPLDGLGVDENGVLYHGVPLSQQSTGLQMRISAAIAMALNPTLRVILLRDAALLDEEGLAEITALAEAQDYQLWIERVGGQGPVGIYIEDGAIVAVNGEKVNTQKEA